MDADEQIQGLIRATERVGVTPRQNFEWLLNFAQDRTGDSEDEHRDVVSTDVWDEIRVFISRWNGPAYLMPIKPTISAGKWTTSALISSQFCEKWLKAAPHRESRRPNLLSGS